MTNYLQRAQERINHDASNKNIAPRPAGALDAFWEYCKDNIPSFYEQYYDKYLDNDLEAIKAVDGELYKWLERQRRRANLKVINYLENVKLFWEEQPFFYDKAGLFWFWNKKLHKWEIVDEVDVMNAIEKELDLIGLTIKSSTKANYLEAFKRWGRQKHPKEPKKEWVQFKQQVYDMKKKTCFEATPEYFICNPIPWEIGNNTETPIMDKLFEEWVGKDYVQTLYEIISYCCLTDYPIHLIFCFIGVGRNGKTKYQQLLTRFVGEENCTSTELDSLLDSRFESAKLYKKMVCTLGETNFGIMKKTSLLKRLVGQDLIGYEFKRKNPFDDYNYAKILINSNSLPTSEDTSEGFYRRWFIIDFPNTFPEGKDILENIPSEEYNNLACKVTKILPELLSKGKFSQQGTIEARKRAFVLASNPLPLFLEKCCTENPNLFVRHSELYLAYCSFLKNMKRRRVSKREFNSALLDEGFEARRTFKTIDGTAEQNYYVENLGLNLNWKEVVENLDNLDQIDHLDTKNTTYHFTKGLTEKVVSKTSKWSKTPQNNPQNTILVSENGYSDGITPESKKIYSSIVTNEKNSKCHKKTNLDVSGNYGKNPESQLQNKEKLGTRSIPKKSVKKDWESLKNTIQIIPTGNAILIDEKFDIDFVKKCLTEGLIAEYKRGTYSVVR